MNISLGLIVINSEHTLEYAIDNIPHNVVKEIIIIDTGSSDKAITIARKYTNNIFILRFENDYSKLRNFITSKSSGDWILFINSDERLSKELIRKIPALIQNTKVDGYWFSRRAYISSKRYLRYGLFYPDWQLRLFRNKKRYHYEGAVHETLNIPEEKTLYLALDILHYPRIPKYTSFRDFKNLIPYIKIQARELQNGHHSILSLIWKGKRDFLTLFFGGFFRGKGFLDGWAGFRAHVIFAAYIASGYFLAAWMKLKKDLGYKYG